MSRQQVQRLVGGCAGAERMQHQLASEQQDQQQEAKIVFWDERLSTVAAEKALIEADVRRNKRRKVIDKMAAIIILQGWMDLQSRSG